MFVFPKEEALSGLSRIQIRFWEALYYFQQFRVHCGSRDNSGDSSFHWIAYSDAFLISLLSIQDFLGPKKRQRFLLGYDRLKKMGASILPDYTPNPLLVLKLLRNQTVHHCVLAAPGDGRGKGTVSRIINMHGGGSQPGKWVEPRILITRMESLMIRVKAKYRRAKKKNKQLPNPASDLKEVRLYIRRLKALGQTDIRLETIFREGYEAVAAICKIEIPSA